ncbi:unnamed protein product [Mytilus edulis]|uniref:Uncharacterized protein n=1 Tax=Mytilus edulis TaxID=6550 RepID=A0A8S3U3E8_MYTED|nr:unnamed protein product [Mytilus edulis]
MHGYFADTIGIAALKALLETRSLPARSHCENEGKWYFAGERVMSGWLYRNECQFDMICVKGGSLRTEYEPSCRSTTKPPTTTPPPTTTHVFTTTQPPTKTNPLTTTPPPTSGDCQNEGKWYNAGDIMKSGWISERCMFVVRCFKGGNIRTKYHGSNFQTIIHVG